MLYDSTSGELLIANKDNEKNGFIVVDNSLTGFQIHDNEHVAINFIKIEKEEFLDSSSIDRTYFALPFSILKNSKNLLIVDYRKYLSEPNSAKSGYTSISNDKKYKKNIIYYILNKENKYVKTKLTKRSVLKKLKGNKKGLKSFIRKNNLKMNNEKDIVMLLNYFHKK